MKPKTVHLRCTTVLLIALFMVSCKNDSDQPNSALTSPSCSDGSQQNQAPVPVPSPSVGPGGDSGQPTDQKGSQLQKRNNSPQDDEAVPSSKQTVASITSLTDEQNPEQDSKDILEQDSKNINEQIPFPAGMNPMPGGIPAPAGQTSNQRIPPLKPVKPSHLQPSAKRRNQSREISNSSVSDHQQTPEASANPVLPAAAQQIQGEARSNPVTTSQPHAADIPSAAGDVDNIQDLQNLSPKELQNRCRNLSPETLKKWSPNYLSSLDPSCYLGLAQNGLAQDSSKASLKNLTEEQMGAIADRLLTCFHQLSPKEQLKAITGDQFEFLTETLPVEHFPFLMQKHYGHRRWANKENYLQMKKAEEESRNNQENYSVDFMFNYSSMQQPSEIKQQDFFLEKFCDKSANDIRTLSLHVADMKYCWSLPLLSNEQTRALTVSHIEHLPPEIFKFIPLDQARAFTQEQVKKILSDDTKVRNLNQNFLKILHPELDGENAESHCSIEKLGNFGAEKKLKRGFFQSKKEDDDWKAEFKAMILHWGKFDSSMIHSIRPSLFNLISEDDLELLGEEQTPYLLPKQIASLHEDVFDKWKIELVWRLTKEQIRPLFFDRDLDEGKIRRLLPKLSEEQLSWIKPKACDATEAYKILHKYSQAYISEMSSVEVTSLSTEELSVLSFSDKHMKAFKDAQIPHFSGDAIAGLDRESTFNFIRPEITKSLIPHQLRKVNSDAIKDPSNDSERRRADHFEKTLEIANALEPDAAVNQ